MPKKYTLMKIFLIFKIIITSSCAYFNYFYNANEFYDQAQIQILDLKEGEKFSSTIVDLLDKTIQRCNIVIDQYPDSKFIHPALSLKSKALFYKKDYVLSRSTLEKLSSYPINELLKIESKLWVFKCNWYIENNKSVIDSLNIIIKNSYSFNNKEQKLIISTAYLTLANIYEEINMIDSSLFYLNQRSLIAKDRSSRMKASYLIAEKAYKEKKYKIALENFKKTANFHPSIKINKYSNLMVIRIYRELEMWNEASLMIELLINDEKFESIKPELLLELANLNLYKNKLNESIEVFQQITENYPKTIASAEAYFKIANFSLDVEKNYSKAKKLYDNVELDYPESIFVSTSKSRVNEINLVESYFDSIKISKENLIEDSTNYDIIEKITYYYYNIAEIEAFRFNHIKEGISYFNLIVNQYPTSSSSPKSLFSLFYLYEKNSQFDLAKSIQTTLLKEYPDSDYSRFISNSIGLNVKDLAGEKMTQAELLINKNPDNSISIYKNILNDFPNTSYASSISLAIAYIYDYNLNDFDSAYSEYKSLIKKHPSSDQAIFASKRLIIMDKAYEFLSDSLSIKNE